MLHSKNIEDVLKQGLTPVRTTSKSLLAVSLIAPTGAPLSSYIDPKQKNLITNTKLRMFSLLVVNAYANDQNSEEQQQQQEEETQGGEGQEGAKKDEVFGIEVEGFMLYLKCIKGTRFSVVLVSEQEYPLGVIRLKLKNLSDAFEELSKFEYVEES